jgi:threonine-phosphate decarboxylase
VARSLGLKARDLLDFSANINPLGYPPGAAAAAAGAWREMTHYPDRQCQDLKEALAEYHQLTPEEILVGNGSTELIYLVVRALRPRRVLIATPAFSEYEAACRMYRTDLQFHPTSEEDSFTLGRASDLGGADLVFLANPASPSGALLAPEELLPLVTAMAAAGSFIVLDEAFIDFVEEASFQPHLRSFPRLIILRSFTKFFGIPGLRLGYLMAEPGLTAAFAQAQEPWSVNTVAQAVGLACLEDRDFMARSREVVTRERDFLLEEMAGIPGLKVFPGKVNYLLGKLTYPGWTAARLRQDVLERRILIRNASNFRGLDERFFRVAVRLRGENEQLLTALKACLAGG